MKLLPIRIWLWLLIALPSLAASQPISGKFVVASLPRKAGYSKDQLNADLARAFDRKQVVKIIQANPKLKDVYIVLQTVNKNGENIWLPINSPDKKDEETQWVLLQSKAVNGNKFSTLTEIRENLTDSIFVLDTLSIGFNLSGGQFNNNGFYFEYTCDANGPPQKLPLIINARSYTSLTQQSFSCNLPFVSARLFNTGSPGRQLTRTYFIFADEPLRELLTDMTVFTKANNPSLNSADITPIIQAFIRAHYGKINYAVLHTWVTKSLTANPK